MRDLGYRLRLWASPKGNQKVVRAVGIEPTLLSEPDFESGASTSSTTPAAVSTVSSAFVWPLTHLCSIHCGKCHKSGRLVQCFAGAVCAHSPVASDARIWQLGRMMKHILLWGALAMLATSATAEELPIGRVFDAPALNGPAPRGVELSPDGAFVTYLKPEPNDPTMFDLWARPVRGGEPRRLIEGAAIEPRDAVLTEVEKSRRERQRIAGDHGVVDYKWDETGKTILIPAGGNLYLADAATGTVKKLGDTGGGATDARISPKGGYVTYVRDQNLHVLDLKTGEDRRLTSEGGEAISFGAAEFVAQEEMDRYTGYWTAPGDDRIAFTRIDESQVDIVPRFEIGAEGAAVVNQRYPRAGRPNAKIELFVTALTGGKPVKVDLGPETDIYLARVDWAKDGKTLYVQRESRDQTRLDLLAVDPATGTAKAIVSETRKPWINLDDTFTPLKDGNFIWGSERTGFHHLYLYR
ncbi:MAG: dipeptidyl-peptidase 4, partial [Aliidongia sp.]|nr:dipeptidyl-peptidase 4 [Aliidongia sp.]